MYKTRHKPIKLKLALLVLFIGPLGIILESCFGNNCKCPEVNPFLKIEKSVLDLRNHAPGSSLYQVVGDSGKFAAANFTLFLGLQYSYYAQSTFKPNSLPFTNQAFACDCATPGYSGSVEKIKSITLTTKNDYNSTFKAGDTLNNIVSIGGKSVQDFILDWNQNSGYGVARWEISMSQNPDAEAWQQLIVSVKYGGNDYQSSTSVFRLIP
jgi:hypothetical protein